MYVNYYFNRGDTVVMPSGYSINLVGIGSAFNDIAAYPENITCQGFGAENLPLADFEVTSASGTVTTETLQSKQVRDIAGIVLYVSNVTNGINEGYFADVTVKDASGTVLAANNNFRSGDVIAAGQTSIVFSVVLVVSVGDIRVVLEANSSDGYVDEIVLRPGEEKQILGVNVKLNSFSRGTDLEPLVGYNISNGFNSGFYENGTYWREFNISNIGSLKIGESVTAPNGANVKLKSIYCLYQKFEPTYTVAASLKVSAPNGTSARANLYMGPNSQQSADFQVGVIDFTKLQIWFSKIYPGGYNPGSVAMMAITVNDSYPTPTPSPAPTATPSPTPTAVVLTSTPSPTPVQNDTAVPNCTLQASAFEAMPNSPITIHGTATDNDRVQKVEVSTNNGTSWSGAAGTNNWNYLYVVPSTLGASSVIKARAFDASGNVNSCTPQNITILVQGLPTVTSVAVSTSPTATIESTPEPAFEATPTPQPTAVPTAEIIEAPILSPTLEPTKSPTPVATKTPKPPENNGGGEGIFGFFGGIIKAILSLFGLA